MRQRRAGSPHAARDYGQGNRSPVIDAATEEDAAELDRMLQVAQANYCVRVDGVPVR